MLSLLSRIDFRGPVFFLAAGWLLVIASYIHPLGMGWDTFIHFWRVEAATSIFLVAALIYFFKKRDEFDVFEGISSRECRLIILPIAVFIAWSAISAVWANSWRSAIHHSLLWSEYLIFFLIVRRVLAERRAYSTLVLMLVLVLVFYSIPAITQYLSHLAVGGNLNTGTTFQKFGEQATALLPLVLLLVLRSTGKAFPLGLIAIAAMWTLVICGLGRMNLLLFGVGFILVALSVLFFKRLHRHRMKLAPVALTLLLVPLGLYLFPTESDSGSLVIASRAVGDAGTSDSNGFRLLMATISLEMVKANPMVGVGADNFGYELNKYRAAYGAQNPNDTNLAQAENGIPERAHNEYLQIVSELGIVGGLIFLWFLFGICSMVILAIRERKLSPFRLAALLGVLIFLASALVTSFSFRLIQNGFVFFFLLAVCSKYFLGREQGSENTVEMSDTSRKASYAWALSACVLLLAFCLIRVASVIYTEQANYEADFVPAERKYQIAMMLDPENPNAFNDYGMRLFNEARYQESVPFLMRSIDLGRGTSIDFSYLASAQSLAGDNKAAEETMAQALKMYPRSPFVLTRYAALLQANGKENVAVEYLERARSIDLRASNTWWAMINKGSKAASALGFRNDNFSAIMDLQPQPAIYAVLAERDVRFPGERDKLRLH